MYTKILDLSETIIEIFDKKLTAEFSSPKIGDIKDSYADITKMKNILLYEPKYSLEQGLIGLIIRSNIDQRKNVLRI